MQNNYKTSFKPAWWLPNAHLQTIWPVITRRAVKIELTRERLELPDGDFVDLDWTVRGKGPIVLVLHGLGGSIESHYAKGILNAVNTAGWRGVFMHFRGCSGPPNRLARSYHSGETSDVQFVTDYIRRHEPDVCMAAVGYSLGGNVLIKWLGETGKNNPLTASVIISAPFELEKTAKRVNHGFSRIYQWMLLRELQEAVLKKFKVIKAPIDISEIKKLNTFLEFDDKVTAPLHGFADAQDYYTKSSGRQFLKHIRIPTLVLHGRDDPFMTAVLADFQTNSGC